SSDQQVGGQIEQKEDPDWYVKQIEAIVLEILGDPAPLDGIAVETMAATVGGPEWPKGDHQGDDGADGQVDAAVQLGDRVERAVEPDDQQQIRGDTGRTGHDGQGAELQDDPLPLAESTIFAGLWTVAARYWAER